MLIINKNYNKNNNIIIKLYTNLDISDESYNNNNNNNKKVFT